jgi:GT2 family glycosyltransferase
MDNILIYKKKKTFPLVSVMVLDSRGATHPHYLKLCLDSIKGQTYPKIEVVLIDNRDKLMSIGKGYNRGVQKSTGKYVLFVNDDDYISEDYVSTLVNAIENASEVNMVGATSYLTLFTQSDIGEIRKEERKWYPPGMWTRKFLLKNPFREYLMRYVDVELMDRMYELGLTRKVAETYGFHYRSHSDQISGEKEFGVQLDMEKIKKIQERIKEIE